MARGLKRGDHVAWNSEAGRVRGVVLGKVVSNLLFKGYVHRASRQEPQYLIRSDKSDHVALHKGTALTLLRSPAPSRQSRSPQRGRKR